jgi:pimeloyl-ACP methyl ester carboxylesterase
MIDPQLVEFTTKDGLELPGVLFGVKKPAAVAIFLHGNGSSSVFYHQESKKPLAKTLNKKGVALLYFNNRGAHYIKKLSQERGKKIIRKKYGMAFEKIKECVFDIDGAIDFLKKQGYKKFYLIGSSTGANKICVYNYYKPQNSVSKYILLGPGDDTGSYYDILGKEKFWKLLNKAKVEIKKRQGGKIMQELLPFSLIFSYQGFYDIANPDGDYNVFPFLEVMKNLKLSKKKLFRHFKSIKKPTFVIFGREDEFAWGDVPGCVEILKHYQPEFKYEIIPGASHNFSEHREELAGVIVKFLV